jgi:methylated-DNA-[protein]-cysteine S-methyltransferase
MTAEPTMDDIEARLRAGAPGPGQLDLSALMERADAEGLVDVAWTSVDSPIGPLWAAASESGLLTVGFGEPGSGLDDIARKVSPRIVELPRRLDRVRRELDEYFEGRRRDFDLPLDRRLSKGFRAEVLRALEQVEFGETVSYMDLATRVGSPRATRAVGTAMATNPLPIVVPCHRVLRTGGFLGGYGGGLDAKRWLLAHEGVEPPRR